MEYYCKRIIDTHVHIGGEKAGFIMTEEDVEYLIDKYKIAYAIVSNCDCVEVDCDQNLIPQNLQINQVDGFKRTLKLARKHPDKIGVAPFIKPLTETLTKDYERIIRDNKDIIKAFKIHAYHSNTSPADPKCFPYWELAEELGVPVVSHTGGCEAADPIHMYEAAKLFPRVDFVMVHMGLGSDNKEALDLLGKADNLYGDTTWVPCSTAIEACKRYGSHKMVFGSDAPIDGKDTYLHNKSGDRSMYQEYFWDLPKVMEHEAYEDLMWRNAINIFHLENMFK